MHHTNQKCDSKKFTIPNTNRCFSVVSITQVVSKSDFNFLNENIFKNISLAAWDPGKYNESLSQW